MKTAPFEYHAPTTLDAALADLDAFDRDDIDVKLLAGGQSLIPVMALRLTRFEHLIDLNRVSELRFIDVDGATLRIGAMTTQAAIAASAEVAVHAPLVTRATKLIGHFQIRNRGTIGGSLSHADGAAEYPAVVLTLDGQLQASSSAGTRMIAAADFFVGPFTTTLEPNEILSAVELPCARPRSGFAVEEMARRAGDFALAGAMCAVRVSADGLIEQAALTFFGIGGTPVRRPAAEAALIGASAATADLAAIATASVDGLAASDDIHASASYRRRVASVLAAQVMQRAIDEAVSGD